MSLFSGTASGTEEDPSSPGHSPISPIDDSLLPLALQPDDDNGLQQARSARGTSDEASGAEEDDYQNRPRFAGHNSAWRRHAKEEITVSNSLLDTRADDLAAHLFDAYAWKSKLHDKSMSQQFYDTRAKSNWYEEDTGELGDPWTPDRLWTAWPLSFDTLRRINKPFWRQESSSTLEQNRPSALREELQATALSIIKRQWGARKVQRARVSRSDLDTDAETTATEDSDASQATAAATSAQDDDGSRPVLSADDERSHNILRPIVDSTLDQVDKLLQALHSNRAGQLSTGRSQGVQEARGRSMSRSRSSSIAWERRRRSSESSSPSRERRSTSRPAKKRRTESPDSEDDRGRGRSAKQGRISRSSFSSSDESSDSNDSHVLEPRDWSEVLGVASMIGWDAQTIERAQARCAALFGEDMTFVTVTENGASDESSEDEEGDEDEDEDENEPQALPSRITDEGIICPEPDCRRATPFPLNRIYRLREHLQRVHKYSVEQLREYEQVMGFDEGRGPPVVSNPRGWKPPEPLLCPHAGCPKAGKIWSEPRRLVDHLRRYHKYDPRTESPPPELKGQRRVGDMVL